MKAILDVNKWTQKKISMCAHQDMFRNYEKICIDDYCCHILNIEYYEFGFVMRFSSSTEKPSYKHAVKLE